MANPVQPVNLPPFREEQLAVWFTLSEGQFERKGVQDRCHWFYTILVALSAQQQDCIWDIAGQSPIPANSYQQVKEQLLQLHKLDGNQQIVKLLDMPSLQRQKPTNMLPKMCQLCPAGEDRNALFCWMFVRRLPEKIKLILAEDHCSSVPEQLAKVVWVLHYVQDQHQGVLL